MKKNKTLIIILSFLTIGIYAQEKKTFWDNGLVKSIRNYDEEGTKIGYWKTYYESGELKESGYYSYGKKSGNWNEYYYDGERKTRTRYHNGLMTNRVVYYEDGKTMVEGGFDDNEKKHGRWFQNYNNWQRKIEGDFSHDKKHGKWKYHTKSGKLFKVENYKKGVRTSKWESNSENNSNQEVTEVAVDAAVDAATEEVQVNDVEETVIEETDEIIEDVPFAVVEEVEIMEAADAAVDAVESAAEAVESRRTYRNRLNGQWKFYNDNGKVIEVGNYKNDGKIGKWTYYYDTGRIKKVELWKEGKLMEVLSHVDHKGKALDKGTLKDGSGTLKEYDAQNKLISTTEFFNGEELKWDNSDRLNTLAWNIYETKDDMETIQKGIKFVKRSIELDKNYYNTDTHAALLFKAGKHKQALILANEAIRIAKRDKDNFSDTTKLIEKIKKDMKKK